MRTEPKLNVRLLRQIQRAITKEPRQFYMGWWWTNLPSKVGVREIPNCGTALCIGGWAVALARKKRPDRIGNIDYSCNIGKQAATLLNLQPDQIDHLFCTTHWPAPFRAKFDKAKTAKARARVAVRRIEHLIKTGL